MDAEREERERIRISERERDRRNFEYMKELRKQGWRKVTAGPSDKSKFRND